MSNEVSLDDIKLWLGELLLENRLLQKELVRLRSELEKLISAEKKSTENNISNQS